MYLRDAEGAQAFRVLLLVGLGTGDILEQVDAAGFARGLVLGPDLPAQARFLGNGLGQLLHGAGHLVAPGAGEGKVELQQAGHDVVSLLSCVDGRWRPGSRPLHPIIAAAPPTVPDWPPSAD